MKKLALALTIILTLALPLAAFADVTSYTTGIQLQNLEGTDATVTIRFINSSDGSEAAAVTDTILANSSNTYFPLSAVSAGFNGSVVVESDKRIAAITNVMGNNTTYGSSYIGFSAGADTINIPLVMKAVYGINTWLNVQNTGTADTDVTIDYGGGCTDAFTGLKPGQAHTFNQATTGCLANGHVGAATLTSTGTVPVAVTVVQVTSSTSGLRPNLLVYNGFTTASTNPVMPLVTSHCYNIGTGIQVMNTGGSSTDVTITYTPSTGFPGAACSITKTIAAGQSQTFGYPDLPTECYTVAPACGSTPAFVGAGKVTTNTADMPLVAVVNQLTSGTSSGGAYGAFDASVATDKVSLPLIMDRNYGIFTGFSIANVGASPTNISCTFSGTTYTVSQNDVQPGAALADVQLNKIGAAGCGGMNSCYVGSAVCTATGGDAKIVGVLNQLNTGNPIPVEDGLLVAEGPNY